jgi:hypothetical protein
MKMTVEDLKRFALQHGAKVEIGGKVFNADMQKAGVRPVEVKVEPVVEPKADKSVALMAEAVTFMVKSLEMQNQRLTAALLKPAPVALPAPVTEVKRGTWKFTIVRDRNDLIKEIVATPA